MRLLLARSGRPALPLRQQLGVNERDNPALRDGGVRTDEAVELVVVPDRELEEARGDPSLVVCMNELDEDEADLS